MKKKEKKSKKKIHLRTIILIAAGLALIGGVAFLQVQQPYAITIDGKQIAMVENKTEAERVVRTLIEDYSAEGSEIESISLDKSLDMRQLMLWEGLGRNNVISEGEAVESIKLSSEEENGMVVTVVGTTVTEEEYTPEPNYVKDEEMFVGDRVSEGKAVAGKQLVTRKITTENGETTSEEVTNKEITDEGSVQTIRIGVRGLPEGEDWKTYEGAPHFTDGEDLVEYGKKFLGNPYVKGGVSLTNGCDCVGFVRAMYKYCGYNLPPTLGKVGRRVSVSDIKPGDIVCYYRQHVALYLGNGKIIHAANPKKDICIGNLGSGIKQVRRVL